jgi:hypothetical protein
VNSLPWKSTLANIDTKTRPRPITETNLVAADAVTLSQNEGLDRPHKAGSINLIVAGVATFRFNLTAILRSVTVLRNTSLENFIAACLLLMVLLKLARMEPPYGHQDLTGDTSRSDPLSSGTFGSQTLK